MSEPIVSKEGEWLPLEETPEEIRRLLKPGELAPRNALYTARRLEPTEEDIRWAREVTA